MIERVGLVGRLLPVARSGDRFDPGGVEALGIVEYGEDRADGLDPAASAMPAQSLPDECAGRSGRMPGEPFLDGSEGGAAVRGLHGGEDSCPEVLIAEGAARCARVRADPCSLQSLVPGAEADRRGLVARLDDVILRSAVTAVVARVLDALVTSSGVSTEDLRTRLPVLALIMCPDPAAHQLVWERCWRPLFRSIRKQKLLDELDQQLEDGEGLSRPHLWEDADAGPPHRA